MRYVLINIGSGYDDEIVGKDLAVTSAPEDVLKSASKFVSSLSDGACAEDEFVRYVGDAGYGIVLISSLEDLPIHKADNVNF